MKQRATIRQVIVVALLTMTAVMPDAERAAAVSFWVARTPMPTARSQLGVGVVNGILYAVGGIANLGTGVAPTAVVEAYDPATNAWTRKAPMPTPRRNIGVAVVNGILYAVGGDNLSGNAGTIVEAYDASTNTWTTKAALPIPEDGCPFGTAAASGKVYVTGNGSAPGMPVQAYDPATNTWSEKTRVPQLFCFHQAATVNDTVYLVGNTAPVSESVWAYDPAADNWTRRAPIPGIPLAFRVATLNGSLYAVGRLSGEVQTYLPFTDTWGTAPSMLTPRNSPGVGAVNGVLYAVGGDFGGIPIPKVTAVNEAFISFIPFTQFVADLVINVHAGSLRLIAHVRPRQPVELKALAGQNITLQVADVAMTIPAGSFQRREGKRLAFHGILNRASVDAVLQDQGHNMFQFQVQAARVPNLPTTRRVHVELMLGNHAGGASAKVRPRSD